MAIVGIVHTSLVTYPIIQRYVNEIIPDVEVLHIGDDAMQRDNSRAYPGEVPSRNYHKFIIYTRFLEEAGADIVVLACSTLNKAVELAQPLFKIPLLQIDRPMMELAVEKGEKIGIIATLESTIQPSLSLLMKISEEKKKKVEIHTHVCVEAFQELKKGNIEKHNEILVNAVTEMSSKVDVICLAQLSMSVVEPYLKDMKVPIYNSGRTGITRVKEMLSQLHLT